MFYLFRLYKFLKFLSSSEMPIKALVATFGHLGKFFLLVYNNVISNITLIVSLLSASFLRKKGTISPWKCIKFDTWVFFEYFNKKILQNCHTKIHVSNLMHFQRNGSFFSSKTKRWETKVLIYSTRFKCNTKIFNHNICCPKTFDCN